MVYINILKRKENNDRKKGEWRNRIKKDGEREKIKRKKKR